MPTQRSSPVVLTIAGSDPGGGAGIQADLRTFAALGVSGAAAVTAITAQSSQTVQGIWPVPPEQLAAQLEAVGTDLSPRAVKIGMLGTAGAVGAVVTFLDRYCPPNVVLDPVLASSSGSPLLNEEGRRRLLSSLLYRVDLATPNIPEAEALSGISITDDAAMEKSARWFLEQGLRAVLVKGGHRPGPPRDLLLRVGEPPLWLEGDRVVQAGTRAAGDGFRVQGSDQGKSILNPEPRLETGSGVHGTGCVLAAAIAARLSVGRDMVNAVREGKRFVEIAIRGAVRTGQGRASAEPIAGAGLFAGEAESEHARRLVRLRGLYVVTDSTLRPDRDAAAVVEAAIAGGARAVQLREKQMSTPGLVDLARRLAQRTCEAGVLFLVNDRVDVALAAEADGAHVGTDDMPPADARRVLGPERLLGVSVGTVEEARAAAPYASYFGVGAIFGSRTKADAGTAVSPARIGEIRAAVPGTPIVAIGGIDAGNVVEVAVAGADAVAVVSAVVLAPEMTASVRDLVERFSQSADPSLRARQSHLTDG